MRKYKELSSVERAFDKIKNSLDIRPIYHHKTRRVRGHIFFCILGVLIHSLIERLTEENSDSVIRQLKRIRATSLETPSVSRKMLIQITPRQEQIFVQMDIAPPSEFDLM